MKRRLGIRSEARLFDRIGDWQAGGSSGASKVGNRLQNLLEREHKKGVVQFIVRCYINSKYRLFLYLLTTYRPRQAFEIELRAQSGFSASYLLETSWNKPLIDGIMRKLPHLIVLVLMICGSAAYSQDFLDLVSTDTLWIDSIATHSGQKATLDISFANADTINAFDIPLIYDYPDFMIDSISFAEGRIGDRFITVVEIDTLGAICHLGGFIGYDSTMGAVGPGSGLLARIFMTIPDNYPTRLIVFDTTRLVTQLTFVSKDNVSYRPIFEKGYVNNTFAPALTDSVWVENITVLPGQQFSVTMYSCNEKPVYKINIPIKYLSDNLIFDSVTTAGTRAAIAAVADALADDSQKKALISLRFSDDNLLPVGVGPLAVLHFTCQLTGTTALVNLDTTEFEYGQYYFQLGELFEHIKTYPDFHAGTILIDQSLDVNDHAPDNLPATFSLSQNYPNPFNPSTSIAFALPEQSRVVLEVFNVLGQQVRQLVDRTLPAGNHSVIFDGLDKNGHELASGVYLYRIKTESCTQSKKMLLMK